VVVSRSVGRVRPRRSRCAGRRGAANFDLIYETYGTLNAHAAMRCWCATRCRAHHHVAGTYADAPDNVGWWDNLIGPGKPLDTRKFFVIGVNNLGGCHGSTGPVRSTPPPAGPGAPISPS
jgi:homoserine O-acetyltransferase